MNTATATPGGVASSSSSDFYGAFGEEPVGRAVRVRDETKSGGEQSETRESDRRKSEKSERGSEFKTAAAAEEFFVLLLGGGIRERDTTRVRENIG